MGIPFTVKPSVSIEWAVDVAVRLDERCVPGGYLAKLSVPVPIDQAPDLKARGRLVIMGDLIAPYFRYSENDEVASLDNPNPTSTATLLAFMRATRAIIIDGAGKEVWTCSED